MPGVESVAFAATAPFGMMQLGKSVTPSDAAKDAKPVGSQFNIVSEFPVSERGEGGYGSTGKA